jgi:NO-binding membrane sensor protein with MHYT domain
MPVSDQPWLVLLSIGTAVAGGHIGLRLASGIGAAGGSRRRLLLAGAAGALGVAIWALHFTATLAVRAPFALSYVALPTLLSLLVCVPVAGVALYAASSGPLTPVRLAVSSCALGACIFAAHAIAMTALQANTRVMLAPGFAAAGLVIAIAFCALALWLAMGRANRPPLILAALAFGAAVAAMHFIDMAGVALEPRPALTTMPVLSAGLLTIIVAVVIFGVFGLFLLLLVPERAESGAEITMTAAAPAPSEPDEVPLAAAASAGGSEAELRRGIFAPLGGAGAPPPRLAEHLPIERDSVTHFLPVGEVVAVQANAHYTYLFDGANKLFCPLAIGEVEALLDRARFMRVHRSHIINIERVTGTRRAGDSELVELAGDSRLTVPVSRSRAGSLKMRIRQKNSEPGATRG